MANRPARIIVRQLGSEWLARYELPKPDAFDAQLLSLRGVGPDRAHAIQALNARRRWLRNRLDAAGVTIAHAQGNAGVLVDGHELFEVVDV